MAASKLPLHILQFDHTAGHLSTGVAGQAAKDLSDCYGADTFVLLPEIIQKGSGQPR